MAEISEEKRAEAALRASESRFRSVIENSWDGLSIVDGFGITRYASPSTVRILGYAPHEFEGRSGMEFVHPEDAPFVADSFRQSLSQPGKSGTTVYRMRHKDGSWRWIETTATNLLADPAVRGIVLNSRDVTERKSAEEAQALLAALVNSSEDAIASSDLGARIRSWNPAAERLFGYAAAEILGKPGLLLVPPELHDEALARIAALRRGEPLPTFETVRLRKGGEPIQVSMTSSAVLVGGQLVGFSSIYRDVTEKRSLEEQLRHTQKMDAIGQLAAGVAHDFNNLLTIINGYSELLIQQTPDDDPSRVLLQEIADAGERSATLTRQLLLFSRKQIAAPRQLDLNEVVARAERMLRRLIGADIQLRSILASQPVPVRADPGQLEQVLLNLAANARGAMPHGGQLTIETRALVPGAAGAPRGRYAFLAVTDTGAGMSRELQNRIFEPYFTTKETGKGTGLGLAVVHGIVKEAGGNIEVVSEIGAGAAFKIYLPQLESFESQPPAPVPAAVPNIPTGVEIILLVEDEDSVRALAKNVLAGLGYHVLEADDGAEALRLLDDFPGEIHLLITDVVMPHLGGRELVQRVAARFPDLCVLYVSGYADDEGVRDGAILEKVNFLQKPFSPSALAMKVRESLDGC